MMMIKLYHPVEVTQSVAPISLPTGPPDGGMLCSVSGWGNMAMGEEGELTTPALTRLGHVFGKKPNLAACFVQTEE